MVVYRYVIFQKKYEFPKSPANVMDGFDGISAVAFKDYAENYYEQMGLSKTTVTFCRETVRHLERKSEEEVAEILKQSYEGFSSDSVRLVFRCYLYGIFSVVDP